MTDSFSPGLSRVVTLTRPQSGSTSDETSIRSGPSMMWSIAAATEIWLWRVVWSSSTRASRAQCSCDASGFSRTAATRGSLVGTGSCSFATSSDCTTMRTGASTASTS